MCQTTFPTSDSTYGHIWQIMHGDTALRQVSRLHTLPKATLGHWSLTQTLTIDYPLAGTRPQGRKSLTCAATRTESCPDRQIISYSDNFPDLRLYLRPYVTIAPASQSDSVNQTSRVTTSDHRHLHLRRTRPQGRKSLTCAATRTESCPERQIIS